jgi:cerevisin
MTLIRKTGINWASNDSKSKGGLAVATMSLGGGANTSVDSAVNNVRLATSFPNVFCSLVITQAIAGGLHFSIAAGNSNVDASTTSPARVAAANTVGAVDSTNTKGEYSSPPTYRNQGR